MTQATRDATPRDASVTQSPPLTLEGVRTGDFYPLLHDLNLTQLDELLRTMPNECDEDKYRRGIVRAEREIRLLRPETRAQI